MLTPNESLLKANHLLQQGKTTEAAYLLRSLLQTDKTNAEAWWLMSQSLTDPDQRQRCVERTLRLNPNHAQAKAWLFPETQKSERPVVMQLDNITRELQQGEVKFQALRGLSLQVMRGELLGIIGPSGSGKSTLLGLMGGLDTPTSGQILLDGEDISRATERQLTRLRNEKIGFVFQSFNLISTLTALENVALPLQFARRKVFTPHKRAKELLELFGLQDRLHHRPAQLSGGQQQRVALARALANNPSLLLGDEPTGNLDSAATEVVMNALREVQQHFQTTIVLVTHSPDIASQMDRLVTLVDGQITSDIDPRVSANLTAVKAFREKRVTGELRQVPS